MWIFNALSKMLKDTSPLIELLDTVYNEKMSSEALKERIELFGSLIESAVSSKVIETDTSISSFTSIHQSIWEELKELDRFENTKELLTLISKFNEGLSLLDIEITRNFKEGLTNPEPTKGTHEISEQEKPRKPESKENIRKLLKIVETIQGHVKRIKEVASKCWKQEEYGENSKKYFDDSAEVCEKAKVVLDRVIINEIENMGWPFQADPQDNEQEIIIKLIELISKENTESMIPAVENFNKLMRELPNFFARHYIDRLKIRMQYHFSEDEDIISTNRPELILNYAFDQIKMLKQYTEDIDKPDSFDVIRNKVIDEVMLILIDSYKENNANLLNRMSSFFMFLEEVSQFQSRLNQHFGYVCDKKHSLFYYVLNDRITGKSVSVIWRELDYKLAEKRINEILNVGTIEMIEQIETLLEHYITSYFTLPGEIRVNFYNNAEEFILKKILNYFNNRIEMHNYDNLLKKSGMKSSIDLDIILSKMIKTLMRQKERLTGNKEVENQYAGYIGNLEETRRKFYERCGVQIAKALLSVLKKDINFIKDQSEKPIKFLQCSKIVVDKLFYKFLMAELHQTVEEITFSILKNIEKQVKGENWMKELEKFKKEIIEEQFQDMWKVFADKVPKIEETAGPWRMRIEQELNK